MLPYNGNLREHAKELRKHQTRHENHLWFDFLKNYPIGFRQQRIIENYIVDFYCSKVKLAIELDGTQHFVDEGPEYDRKRTERLERLGIKVLRFSNYEIDHEFEGVCIRIDDEVKRRMEGDSK